MASLRLSGVLFKHRSFYGDAGKDSVCVLLSTDLYVFPESKNFEFVNDLHEHIHLVSWTRLKDAHYIQLSRDKKCIVQRYEDEPTKFRLKTSILFSARTREEADMWCRALYYRVTPLHKLLPDPARTLDLQHSWIINPYDAYDRMRTVSDVGQLSKLDPAFAWTDLFLAEQGGLETLRSWTPIVGIALNLLALGVRTMSRVAIFDADVVMEPIVRSVLTELSKCLQHPCVHQKRFEAIATILTTLEDILRPVDNMAVQRRMSKFRFTRESDPTITRLDDLSKELRDLSIEADLDTIVHRTEDIHRDVRQLFYLVHAMNRTGVSQSDVGQVVELARTMSIGNTIDLEFKTACPPGQMLGAQHMNLAVLVEKTAEMQSTVNQVFELVRAMAESSNTSAESKDVMHSN